MKTYKSGYLVGGHGIDLDKCDYKNCFWELTNYNYRSLKDTLGNKSPMLLKHFCNFMNFAETPEVARIKCLTGATSCSFNSSQLLTNTFVGILTNQKYPWCAMVNVIQTSKYIYFN